MEIKSKRTIKDSKKLKPKEIATKELLYEAANAAEDKKGTEILLLDVSKLTVISDYFLLITANSSPQARAIANNIEVKLKELERRVETKEGSKDNSWVVLDYGDMVVHIMTPEIRDFYKLERFWSNAIIIDNKTWKKAS